MNLLLVSCPKPGQVTIDRKRFSKMAAALEQGGVSAKYFAVNTESQLMSLLSSEQADLVFSASYYVTGNDSEKVNIHQVLEKLQIPYVGSSAEVLERVLSKSRLKKRWLEGGVSTPEFYLMKKGQTEEETRDIHARAGNYPYILKPDKEGNSRGLDESSIVLDWTSLILKLRELLESYKTVLVERYLGGATDIREFTVAMIGNEKQGLVLPASITLIKKKVKRIITTADKDNHNTLALPVIDPPLREILVEFAKRAFAMAGVRDYARCDLMFSGGKLYAIEINGQPMIPDRWFEVCASGCGLSEDQYLNAVVLAGISRICGDGRKNISIPPEMQRILPQEVFKALTA